MIDSNEFYSSLKPFIQFQSIFNHENYIQLPQEWAVVITDVERSTQAIEQNKYRQVNAIGVASIVAIINEIKPLSIPYVFGGDGATLCIPNSFIPQIKKVLIETQKMAKENFSLTLRCGIVPYSVISQSNIQILVGKFQVSEHYFQAAFSGGGISLAEKLVKNDPQKLYNLSSEDTSYDADFTGFECRWKDVPSPHPEIISLLVMSLEESSSKKNRIYQEVFEVIEQIYGNIETHRPVQKKHLELITNRQLLQDEIKIRAGSSSKPGQFIYSFMLPWKIRLGRYWMHTKKHMLNTDWGAYKDTLIVNTDFRKFDENLRMVISGNALQREALINALEKHHKKGLLVYGIHVSNRALMTCVISDYNYHHIHFIDGADGGYAMASKALKQQLKNMSY